VSLQPVTSSALPLAGPDQNAGKWSGISRVNGWPSLELKPAMQTGVTWASWMATVNIGF